MADELTGGPESAAPEESFADLFKAYEGGATENLKIGDKVRGRIISVEKDSVFVDTGTKMDGVVNKAELLDDKGEFPFAEGQEIDLYVTAIGGGTISLSKAVSGQGGLDMLRDAYDSKVPVEGRVKEACKGGFSVTVMNRRAFCPQSQIDLRFAASPDDYVGNTYQFLITKFEDRGRNIVVSRRVLLEIEQKEATEQFRSSVQAGALLDGRVVRIQPFGAFVELVPGIEGLVHVSELSWSRVEDPAEAVAVGDTLRVKVLGMEERADKRGRMEMKISLSAKQAGPNPWDSVEGTFKAGDSLTGKVTRLTNFGAFVELAPGIEGLVHISEMSYVKRVHRPEDIVNPGQAVTVVVKEIDLKKRRISLSLREAEGDPWQDVPDKFKAGQSVTGVLEKKEQFGFFVTLAPGVTGLLPKSRISKSAKPADLERLNPGDALTVVVEEVRPTERKITLGLGDSRDEGDWKKFSKEQEKTKEAPMGSLADKLQAAMDAKRDK